MYVSMYVCRYVCTHTHTYIHTYIHRYIIPYGIIHLQPPYHIDLIFLSHVLSMSLLSHVLSMILLSHVLSMILLSHVLRVTWVSHETSIAECVHSAATESRFVTYVLGIYDSVVFVMQYSIYMYVYMCTCISIYTCMLPRDMFHSYIDT